MSQLSWMILVCAVLSLSVYVAVKAPKWYRIFKISCFKSVTAVRQAREKALSKSAFRLSRETEEKVMQLGEELIKHGKAQSNDEAVIAWYREAGYSVERAFSNYHTIAIPPVTEKEVNDIMLKS